LNLTNITTTHSRVEAINDHYAFIVSRAVTAMPAFVGWVKNKVLKKSRHDIKNGILYLKGGDLTEELRYFPKATLYNLSDFFDENFFETKKVVHLPLKYKG
jgi:16S rRNA (guanine527-N7)-methyltransferase